MEKENLEEHRKKLTEYLVGRRVCGAYHANIMDKAEQCGVPFHLSDQIISDKIRDDIVQLKETLEGHINEGEFRRISHLKGVFGHRVRGTLLMIHQHHEFYGQSTNDLNLEIAKSLGELLESSFSMSGLRHALVLDPSIGFMDKLKKYQETSSFEERISLYDKLEEEEKPLTDAMRECARSYSGFGHDPEKILEIWKRFDIDYKSHIAKCQALVDKYHGKIQVDFEQTKRDILEYLNR